MIPFLTRQPRQLPPNILQWFNSITTPQQCKAVLLIRNRRFNFTQRASISLLRCANAALWEEPIRIGQEEAREEKEWADTTFLGSEHQTYVGKLGTLLGGYEEERHSERHRQAKRTAVVGKTSLPEPTKADSDHDCSSSTPSHHKLYKSCSYVKLENDLFMDIWGIYSTLPQSLDNSLIYCTSPV